jgi:hypothetical protein
LGLKDYVDDVDVVFPILNDITQEPPEPNQGRPMTYVCRNWSLVIDLGKINSLKIHKEAEMWDCILFYDRKNRDFGDRDEANS